MNDLPEPIRPKMPIATKLNLGEYTHWTAAVNLMLEHLERQNRTRFSEKDAEALINIKAWLDQATGE